MGQSCTFFNLTTVKLHDSLAAPSCNTEIAGRPEHSMSLRSDPALMSGAPSCCAMCPPNFALRMFEIFEPTELFGCDRLPPSQCPPSNMAETY